MLNLFNRKILKVIISLMLNICYGLSSKWAPCDSWVSRGCCKLPEMYPQHMKIRQGPTPPADFHTIPTHFIQNYLQIKHYESISVTVCNWNLFILSICTEFLIGWGKNQTCVYGSIWLEDSFGSCLGWDHTVPAEKNLFLGTISKSTALVF